MSEFSVTQSSSKLLVTTSRERLVLVANRRLRALVSVTNQREQIKRSIFLYFVGVLAVQRDPRDESMTRNKRVGLQSHFVFEWIALRAFLALIDGGEIDSLLFCATFCDSTWITAYNTQLQAVDKREIRGRIFKDGNGACFDQISFAFFRSVLASEAPMISVAGFFSVSVRNQHHVHDLANLLERRIKLRFDKIPASAAEALVVESDLNFGRLSGCTDGKGGKDNQQDSEVANGHVSERQQRTLVQPWLSVNLICLLVTRMTHDHHASECVTSPMTVTRYWSWECCLPNMVDGTSGCLGPSRAFLTGPGGGTQQEFG